MPVDRGELIATVVVLAAVPCFPHILKIVSYLSRFDMKFYAPDDFSMLKLLTQLPIIKSAITHIYESCIMA